MRIRLSPLGWAFALYAVVSLLSMAAMSIGAALLALTIFIWLEGPKRIFGTLKMEVAGGEARLYFRASVFLLLALATSLIVAMIDPLGYGGNFVHVHFWADMAKGWYLFWPLLLAPALRGLPERERNTVLSVWMVAFGALSALGIVQYFVGWPRPQVIPDLAGGITRYHATLFLGHHLSVASIFIFPFFVCLDLLDPLNAKARKKTFPLPRWLLALFAVLGAATLFFTYSRTLWVALPLGVFVWAVWAFPRKWAIGAVLAALIAGTAAYQLPAIHGRLHDSMGVGTRENLWLANLEFFQRRPVTGAGWRHNQELSGYYLMDKLHSKDVFSGHAHNDVLDMLGGTGLLGTIAWIAWWVVLIRLTWNAFRGGSPVFARGVMCAWLVFQINGLTQVNFWEGKVLHQVTWVVAWLLAEGKARKA